MGGVVSQVGQNMGNSRFGPPQQSGGGKGGPIASAVNQSTQQPNSIEGLYQTVLGRAPDQGGADYWKQQFGDTIDANEVNTFRNAAQAELANHSPAEQAALAPNLVNPPQNMAPTNAGGKGASSVNSYPGSQATFPGQGGQPRMGMKNQYSNTLGGWDNTQIRPVGQQGKGKGG